jgi:hypothetical protein
VTISKDKSSKEAVIEGQVLRGGAPVSPGYARLLGTGDEFVAEVPLGEDGGFRFFAAPGDTCWCPAARQGFTWGP